MCKQCGKRTHNPFTPEEEEKIRASRTPLWTAFFLSKARAARAIRLDRPEVDGQAKPPRFAGDQRWKGENDE